MSDRQVTAIEVRKINKERDDLDSLYYIRRSAKSIEGLNFLLKKRRAFYEKYDLMLDEFVLWGKYLLTFRGTIQEIDQRYLCGKPVELTTLNDFMRMVSSLRTEEVKIPEVTAVCAKCHKLITIKDVEKGNFTLCDNKFVHARH